MKTITLKFGKERINGQDTFFSTLALLKVALNHVGKNEGLSVTEMSQRMKILDILSENPEYDAEDGAFTDIHLSMSKEINLEDADFLRLKELFKDVKWKIVSRFIINLSEEIENVKI